MRARFPFAVATALAIATPAPAADAPRAKSPWEGFGVGSWVHVKKVKKMDFPGMAMPDEVTDVRETLVRRTDDAHTVGRESKTDETGWASTGEVSYPRRDAPGPAPGGGAAPKVEDSGTEKVTVEGKAYDCKKSRTTSGDTVTTTWTSASQGVLKTEVESPEMNGRIKDVRTVTAFAKKVNLAGTDLVCRETTTFTKFERPGVPSGGPGDGTTAVELTSDAVPGRRVRMEISTKRLSASISSLEELVAFEAKPP